MSPVCIDPELETPVEEEPVWLNEAQPGPEADTPEAKQRIRELERELGRKALENAMLREAVEFAHLPVSAWRRTARATPRKK